MSQQYSQLRSKNSCSELDGGCESIYSEDDLNKLQDSVSQLEVFLNSLKQSSTSNSQTISSAQVRKGTFYLALQASSINALSAQLEAEILKFVEMAQAVNRAFHTMQSLPPQIQSDIPHSYRRHPLNIWEIHHSVVPKISRRNTQFFITSKPIKLATKIQHR